MRAGLYREPGIEGSDMDGVTTVPDSGVPLKPTTEAGRRLVKWSREGQVPWDVTLETVLAIEAELTRDVERLRVLRDVLNQWLYSDGSDPGAEEALVIAAREWLGGEEARASQPLTLDVGRQVVAAAVEWVAAHDALTVGQIAITDETDAELLERYSAACIELLAVVSQNRATLASKP